MGCSKNLVDSEHVVKMMQDAGIRAVHNADGFCGDAVVINTCGFIGDAKEESVDMILRACQAKSDGIIDKVYVMGCLSERYRKELQDEIPEVDRWYGKFDWKGLVSDIKPAKKETRPWERTLATPGHYAYVKISEGCNRFCSFCAIPLITGRHHSRPVEEIVEEVKDLVAKGVKEFNIIAQDLSSYGADLYGKSKLAALTEAISDVEGVEFIRLHYAYPADFPLDVLDVMASRKNVCRYLDIALQHADDRVLSNMRRHITLEETERLLDEIRRRVPGIHIRTTLMTGFPGEDGKAFETLLDFVRRQKFERMGAFAYSEEEGTYGANNFNDDIPQKVKQTRLDKLMELQRGIAEDINASKIGTTMRVIVDEVSEGMATCRSEFDSPEVDPVVMVKTGERALTPGDILEVKVDGYDNYDLLAHISAEGADEKI